MNCPIASHSLFQISEEVFFALSLFHECIYKVVDCLSTTLSHPFSIVSQMRTLSQFIKHILLLLYLTRFKTFFKSRIILYEEQKGVSSVMRLIYEIHFCSHSNSIIVICWIVTLAKRLIFQETAH